LVIDDDAWLEEIDAIEHYLSQFGERVPQSLRDELQHLRERFTG
jgi:GTP-dependent phosphoenolpyruvate carboxykinase